MFTNWLTSSSANSTITQFPPPTMTSTPPDIILEVGPSPSVRFVAHSIILSMHSGYLRSAIRLDENGGGNSQDMVLFLTNVTADQFAPLLTYMYTGYLDLNVENIFGVLLGTHVLHMPRALEICRAFLSRAQSEGYLNNGHFLNTSNNKVIRPIPSKASAPNLGFIAPPMQHVSLPSTGTPFKSLQHQFAPGPVLQSNADDLSESDTQSIAVASPKPTTTPSERESSPKSTPPPPSILHLPAVKRHHKSRRSSEKYRNKQTAVPPQSSTPVIVAKEPNLQIEVENKTIIDVASCDGPIRFRRVLNDAYGHKPDVVQFAPTQERTQQSVSFSFHQQMAKTISQRQMQSEESENSEDLNGKTFGNSNNSKSGEIYNCVYCKHTFKSQYCYQKHAKRHLNPLSLDCPGSSKSSSSTSIAGGITAAAIVATNVGVEMTKDEKTIVTNVAAAAAAVASSGAAVTSTATDLQRREVRPLDMNVQYYPCKTCGSKFPSYYFVHKHRKMCHANEENPQSEPGKSEH